MGDQRPDAGHIATVLAASCSKYSGASSYSRDGGGGSAVTGLAAFTCGCADTGLRTGRHQAKGQEVSH
jgi:hypothetical protein